MGEALPKPEEPSEARQVAESLNALLHGNFDVFTQSAHKELMEFFGRLTHGRTVGEFIIQVFLDTDPVKLADPKETSWMAFQYDFVVGSDGQFNYDNKCGYVQTSDNEDLLDIPWLENVPPHITTWEDIDYEVVQRWQTEHDQLS